MTRERRASATAAGFSAQIGGPQNARRFTVNVSAEIGDQLHEIAEQHRISESSVVEIALRQLFRRVSPAALGAFLRDHGACLRRRS
jgi:hypothetical protein